MPLEIDPNWEYWVPDPEVDEATAFGGRTDGFAMLDINEMRTEKQCGNVGVRFGFGNPDRFEPTEARERPAVVRDDAVPDRRTCKKCGREFRPDRNSRAYCSVSCRGGPGRERVLPDVSCAACGTAFRPRAKVQKFCSRECFRATGKLVKTRRCVDELLLVKLYRDGEKMESICNRIGLGEKAVRAALVRLGVQLRSARRPKVRGV